MKVWCVFFVDTDGCLELKAIFHSQDKAVKFAVDYNDGNNTPIEYLIDKYWVK